MQWLERFNNAMDYIEENMRSKINYEEVGKIAMCSSDHFQRMFSFITNVPLSEYIRRRRLTLAAQELKNTSIKVIDVAFKYGYESPDAFSRAFYKIHGVIPSSARETGVVLKAYPRMSFYLTLKGDQGMDYKILEKDSFKVFGKSIEVNVKDNNGIIPDFWKQCCEDGTTDQMLELAQYERTEGKEGKQLSAVLYDFKSDEGIFQYMAAAELPDVQIPDTYQVLEVPKQTWAVFSGVFSKTTDINQLWSKVPDWLQATGYEHAEAPEFEEYYKNSNGYLCEVWIPIVKK